MPSSQVAMPTGTCCDPRIRKALAKGLLDAVELWACPKCGCEWKPRMVEMIRVWEPHVLIEVWR